ncbi:putative Ig domain-containing protein [Rhizobium sp. RCC_161_2]|uniref:putative Ig domain-containing protein n=1 Tax=Rhizobium sp. RCC_161_2 TaxID=3239219 RepID=UPI0035253958
MIRAAIFLLAIACAAPVSAGQIVWRASTAGVLEITAPPPPLEVDPPPVEVGNFGIFYGTTRVRANTSLMIQPLSQSGFPGAGYTYTAASMPTGAKLEASTGMISGKILAAATYAISITVAKDGKQDVIAATIVVE